ncbi:MAG: S-layer homology domain-containing protein, partial [Waterburya sp.]
FQTTNLDFTDLDEVSEQLRQPLKSVTALGILTPYTGNGNTDVRKFAPNQIITRGEYANWLLAANNRYYQDDPGKKILLATKTSEPAFPDVKVNSPNFGAIQGLAEAGLVPSRLTEDSTNLLFRPNAPLTREDLLAWKVPLDMRQALPQASIKALEESWGFQDAADINSTALRALYGDFQNGDRSNVRRIFGYTTLFQPKKPVTRAEAAVSLWYFGYQGDGITAREILATDPESNS